VSLRPLFLAALLSAAVLALTPGLSSAQTRHIPGTLIVTFDRGTDAEARSAIHRRAGGRLEDRIAAINADVVRVPSGGEAPALNRYRAQAAVQVAERDVVRQPLHDNLAAAPTNDPFVLREWGLQNDALSVQPPDTFPRHDADSGIDLNHEEFPRPAKVVADRNFTNSKTTDDRYGHGTHVAGTAAAPANNGKGVAGVAHEAKLLNGKVLNDSGMGSCSAIANGITWAGDPSRGDADVINLSLGGAACSAEKNAVDYAWGKGVVVAAAAGNSNSTSPSCPACYENSIAVAATDNGDYKASFSNYGNWVDVAAPGVKVFSTFPNHRNRIGKTNYDYGSGTSMATPHVAGVAALVRQSISTNTEVRTRIQDFADDVPETTLYWTAGRLNACNAVSGPDSCDLNRVSQ
jgi:thermitase